MLKSSAVAVVSAFLMSGCASLNPDPSVVGPRGLSPSIESLSVSSIIDRQDLLLQDFSRAAGLKIKGKAPTAYQPEGAEWFDVTKAGMALIDGQCHEYLNALFLFKRERDATSSVLTTGSGIIANILAVAGAAANAIAYTAAGFSIASTLFDASTDMVLFQIEPSAISNILNGSREAYRTKVLSQPDEYRSRPDAVLALQGYLLLCTPATIEAEINASASAATYEPKPITDKSPGLTRGSRYSIADQTGAGPVVNKEDIVATEAGEPKILKPQLKKIQSALCNVGLSGDDGVLGGDTRTALAEAQRGLVLSQGQTVAEFGKFRISDRTDLLRAGACDTELFKSPFERFAFSDGPNHKAVVSSRIKEMQGALSQAETGVIADLRRALNTTQITWSDVKDLNLDR